MLIRGGSIDSLKSIWDGYLQFGLNDSSRWLYNAVDFILLVIVTYVCLRLFNSRRGLKYFGLISTATVLLVATAWLTLPGLHLFVQLSLVILLVGLPLFFRERWINMFNGEKEQFPSYLNSFNLGLITIFVSLILLAVSNGINLKTGEFPQSLTLNAVNLPSGTSANFGSITSVRAIVTAPRNGWSSIQKENFSAIVDIANQSEGTYDLPITVNSKSNDIKVLRVNPERVVVTVEPVIRKTVPVTAKFSGRANDDLVPDDPSFEPDKVEVAGSKSIISNITQAVVQVKLDGQSTKINTKVALVALNPSGEIIPGLTFTPADTQITVNLVKAGNRKVVGIKPIFTGTPATGYWVKNITATPSTVSITGSADVLNGVLEVSTNSISVAGLSSSTTLTSTLNLPSGVTVADNTDKVSLKVELAVTETTKSINPEITYEGLSSSLKVTELSPSIITTIISGAVSLLDGLSGDSVKIKLNLDPYKSAGTYALTIRNTDFTLPDGIGLVSFLPSSIEVKLENK